MCMYVCVYIYNFPVLGMKETCENTNKDCGEEVDKVMEGEV